MKIDDSHNSILLEYFIIFIYLFLFFSFSKEKLSKQYSTIRVFQRKFFFQKNILIPNHLFDFIYRVYKKMEPLNLNIHVGYHDIWPGSDSFIKEIFPKKNSIVHFLFYILNIYILYVKNMEELYAERLVVRSRSIISSS